MNERPVVVNPDALSKKLLIKRFEVSTSDENGFTYMYGIHQKRLSRTKLETIRREACLRFIGVLSP